MLKKIFFGSIITVLVLFALFLILPFFLTGLANSYSDEISKLVEEGLGFKLKLENIKFVTTPKLTVGAKIGHIDLAYPTGETFLTADNLQGKLSLIPVIFKNIEIDVIGADNINLVLKIKKDGKFLIEDYLPKDEPKEIDEEIPTVAQNPLPFDLRLSNHLPNLAVNNYNISFIDMKTDKKYSIYGNSFKVSDFILNKKVKLSIDGKIKLHDREQFSYDLKILNKIMPDLDLNDLVFAPQTSKKEKKNDNNSEINIPDILDALYKNQITANLKTDIKTSGTFDDVNLTGKINLSDLSLAVDGKMLPKSNADIVLNDKKIKLNAELYTALNELTELAGEFVTGKHPKLDLTCKSNAKFNSIINIADSVLKTVGIRDLDSLSATGGIDANFNIKSDYKKVTSSGYLKIPSASLLYKLYNIKIDKIFADISLNDNLINIKEAGLSILGHPLSLRGTVSHNAIADICITADKLQIKGLLLTAGQFALLKENDIKSGTISLDIDIKGKLDKILPKVMVNVNDLNVKNIPSDTAVTVYNLTADMKPAGGKIEVNNAKILNPMAKISAPLSKVTFSEKDIVIDKSYIVLDNSRLDISGKVTDYTTKKLNFNINASGRLLASDLFTMIPNDYKSEVKAQGAIPVDIKLSGNDKSQDISFIAKSDVMNHLAILNIDELRGKETVLKGNINLSGSTLKFSNDTGIYSNGECLAILKGIISDLYGSQKLNLNLSTLKNINMVIPYFSKSKMNVGANINLLGTAQNPILKGDVDMPSLSMPELDLTMNDMHVNLNGAIAKGNGTLKEFIFGGIKADNLSSDFELKNDVFCLSNLKGGSFDGKIKGDIAYNLLNTHSKVIIEGTGMNAVKAVEGAAGIKNALSGDLDFSADVTTSGSTDVELMKNLKGKANFKIQNGQLLNIGRFENFLLAKNLLAVPTIKATVDSVSSLAAIKNTSKFKTLDGSLTFFDGWADLSPVRMSGDALSYYITGKYNMINGTANVIVLGRLSAEVVKLLGPIGEMSLSKITTALFGERTGSIVKSLTTNPDEEKTDNIPELSSGKTDFKDFKAVFNGGVESTTSVKSFKWLSECDTSEITIKTIKDAIQDTKNTIEETKKESAEKLNKAIQDQKQGIQEAKKQLEETKQKIKEEQQKQAEENKKQLEETKKQIDETKKELQQSAQEFKDAANELKNLFKF